MGPQRKDSTMIDIRNPHDHRTTGGPNGALDEMRGDGGRPRSPNRSRQSSRPRNRELSFSAPRRCGSTHRDRQRLSSGRLRSGGGPR